MLALEQFPPPTHPFFSLSFGFRAGWVVAHTSEARAVWFTLVLIYSLVLGGGGALNFTVVLLSLTRPCC